VCVCVSRLNKQLQTQRALRLQPAPVGPAAWRNRCLRSVLLPAPTATTPQPCPAALPTASSSWRAWLPPAAVAHALAAGVHLPCPPCTRLRYSQEAQLVTLRRLQHQLRAKLLHLFLTEGRGSALLVALDGGHHGTTDTDCVVAHCRLLHALLCCGTAAATARGPTGCLTRAARLVVAVEE
jgi:hypothetical protein